MESITEKFELWKKACIAYYNSETPIMSDQEFDELSDFIQMNGTMDMINFMNNNITGSDGFIDVSKSDSNIGMQVSLKKIKWKNYGESPSEVIDFLSKGKRILSAFIAPKFDGCSICINMNTKMIKTRGGNDVTKKLINNPSIVMWMSYVERQIMEKKFETNMLCGELVIKKSVFKEKYSEEYSNERNFVAGILNNKDTDNSIINDLDFCPYSDGINPYNKLCIKMNDGTKMNCWSELQLTTISFRNFDIEKYFENIRTIFPYLCDGIVIGYNTDKREIVNNYPTNMVAVKFRTEVARSKVIGIEWSQKKSEKLNPVCIIEPVRLCGTIVQKASAFNYQYIIDNGIGIGSIVEITKSGDIIPNIIKTIQRSKDIEYPKCDYIIDGKNLIVTDDSDISYRCKFYNAIKRLEIKGIGENLSDDIGMVVEYDIFEIFNPAKKSLFLEQLGYNTANWRNFSQVYNVKTLTIADIIYMLQFRHVGTVLAEKISRLLMKQSTDISNIPQWVLNNVCRGEGFKKIQDSIRILRSYGIRVVKNYDDSEYITYEMTGEPPEGTKESFVEKISKIHPNSKHVSLTKSTKILITNDLNSNTSKMTKARKYNIRIITYKQALNPQVWKSMEE